MDVQAIAADIFNTIPDRFLADQADPAFHAILGFRIDDRAWTVTIQQASCQVQEGVCAVCHGKIITSGENWIAVASGAVDPTHLFLAGKLDVEGDVETILAGFSLIAPYRSDQIEIREPSWVIESLGPHFRVGKNDVFAVEGLTCVELARRFGTPLYVTSESQLRDNFRMMKESLTRAYPENEVNVMWAIKSNTQFALRKILNEEGAGGDCFTPGEIHATFITGADPERILLNGSDRSEEAFRMGIEIGMRITIDHMDDLDIIEKIAADLGKQVRTLIRVKCDLPSLADLPSTFVPGISVPFEVLNYKFGITYAEAVEIARAAENCPHIEIQGLHSHIGRDIHLPEHWQGYAYDMVRLCRRFQEDTGITSEILDLGGGFAEKRDPSSHDLSRAAAPFEDYASAVAEGVRTGCRDNDFPLPRLWIEPGRSLVGPTTVMIARVGNVKRTPGVCTWVHVDASCNFLPTVERHNGVSYHLLPGTRCHAPVEETVDIVGPNCSGDLIQPRRRMPKMQRGELLIFLDVGAYNSVAANQFNSIPRPACILVNGDQADVITEAETINDVFARQRIPARLLTSPGGN